MAVKVHAVGVALLVAAAVAGCAAPAATPAPTASPAPMLAGTLTLTDAGVLTKSDVYPGGQKLTDCLGSGGFADIHSGAQIVVKDEAAKTVGAGALVVDTAQSAPGRCVYTFTLALGPGAFFDVSIAGRKGPTYSAADLAAKGYKVDLTLGR